MQALGPGDGLKMACKKNTDDGVKKIPQCVRSCRLVESVCVKEIPSKKVLSSFRSSYLRIFEEECISRESMHRVFRENESKKDMKTYRKELPC